MDFETIAEALEGGELKLNTTDVINIAVLATTRNELIDCDALRDIIAGLTGVKKTALEEFNSAKKEAEKADKEIVAQKAKEWFDALPVGTEVSWKMANGKICKGTKGEQKKDAKRGHVLLYEIPADSKAKNPKPDRYVVFDKFIVEE